MTNLMGGFYEKIRMEELLSRLYRVVPDRVSDRCAKLATSGKISSRSLVIFGTGDHFKAKTVTANAGFVRAVKGQGIDLAVVIHGSSALTEALSLARLPPPRLAILDNPLDYKDFYQKFLVLNNPCLISRACGLIRDWPAAKTWNEDLNAFAEDLDDEVPVYNCQRRHFNSQECATMTLREYIKYWKSDRDDLLYLKDWHFFQKYPNKSNVYRVPSYFSDDWLNEFLCDNQGKTIKF